MFLSVIILSMSDVYNKTMEYFSQLTQIPRVSGKEEGVRDRLIQWAIINGFMYKQDEVGNLAIHVPASLGYEDTDALIIQSHMDMVPVKTPESTHDFLKDPITTYIENDRMKAVNTTLWADNGIGLAMSLAATSVPHPRLELLFTVEEETSLLGARKLNPSLLWLSSQFLLNLDTEENGEICIASAGGVSINVTKKYETQEGTLSQYEISLTWGIGWHSGTEIHLGRANANIVLMQLLAHYPGQRELSSIQWGQASNAIPAECTAVIGIQDKQHFEAYFTAYIADQKTKYTDQNLLWSLREKDLVAPILLDPRSLFTTIMALPIGVREMHPSIADFVQTSVNLGIVSLADGQVNMCYMPRWSQDDSFDILIQEIENHYNAIGFDVHIEEKIPGWSQSPHDSFVTLVKNQYDILLGKEAKIVAVHAWLECGAIAGKFKPNLQAVSLWPDIKFPHSPQEKVYLPSVKNVSQLVEKIFYAFLHR